MNDIAVLYKTAIFKSPSETNVFRRAGYLPPQTISIERLTMRRLGPIHLRYNKIEHACSIDSFNILSIEQHWITAIAFIFLGFYRSIALTLL